MTSYGDPHADEYDDGYRPSTGRAQVPPPSDGYGYGGDDYPDAGPYSAPPPVTARASVPVASGRASVPVVSGRASVGGPGGPGGPGGRPPVRPAAAPLGDDDDEYVRPSKKSSKARRRRRMQKWLIAGIGVLIVMAGGGMIGGSYFYDRIPRPEEMSLNNSTEVFADGGKTQIAKLGNETRSEIVMASLDEKVKHALIAGEDKNFYKHHGIDLWGIARAAWNNLTGGEMQGASTITQQYARQAARDLEVSYARKLREAVMARKLEDQYTKEEILGFYLNTVYFGRGAHGIGAAAQAYFGIKPDDIKKMTVDQAAVLGAVLKQPNGKSGYDPANNMEQAQERWNYVLNNMLENGWLTPEERAKAKYPAPADPNNPVLGVELQKPQEKAGNAWGYADKGTGHVIDRIEDELEAKGVLQAIGTNNWRNAGLRITTTIDMQIQGALEQQLNRKTPNSTMSKQKENIMGAGVTIDPKTGRVLAYFGGNDNGSDFDYASEEVPHQPASSWKIYTLAAAINDGISVKSHWNPTELKKTSGDPWDLGNANRDSPDTCGTYCTLEEMTVASYNVPFFSIATDPKMGRGGIGATKVVQMAALAGVGKLWDVNGKAQDITKNPNGFDPYVGIGKFRTSVWDHAVGTATFAAGGVWHRPHFILKVERKNKKTGAWEPVAQGNEQIEAKQVIRPEVANEVTSVLKKVVSGGYALSGGRESAGKTGTWENGLMKADGKTPVYPKTNAHVWFTGYTAQLSTTIWLGDKEDNKTPIKMANGKDNMGSTFPKQIWKDFMNQAHKDKGYKNEKLAPNHTYGRLGSEDRGNGKSPTPAVECNGWFYQPGCPSRGPGNGGGGGGLPTTMPRPTATRWP